jgi:hypothetical protein
LSVVTDGFLARFFGRFGGRARRAALARKAELSGDLARAAVLYAEAAMLDESARVMILRGDGEPDPAKRLAHFTQAAATAAAGGETARAAKKKRAMLVLALGGEGAISAATRHDLDEAARDLEAIGDQESAAKAYARLGDVEGEARALQQAGDVDKLEFLLTMQGDKDRAARKRVDAHREVELLVASGRRREALAAAVAFAADAPEQASREAMTARAEQIRGRRVAGPTVRLSLRGRALTLVLGDEIVVGRTEGALQIASNAVSRRHLAIARDGDAIVLRDLGSRNGTHLRGLALGGAVTVGDGIDLRLGKEVPLRIAPTSAIAGAVEIDLAGDRYVAPLGDAPLGVGTWKLELAPDGWVELVTEPTTPALIGGVQLVTRTTLLVGDAIATARNEEATLRVLG